MASSIFSGDTGFRFATRKLKRGSRFWMTPRGTRMKLSRLMKRNLPFFWPTPMTSKRRPSMKISFPTGSTKGKSASATSAPMTATLRALSTSASMRNRPFSTYRSCTCS